MQVGRQTKTTRQSYRQSDGRDSGERLKEKFKRNSKHEGLSKRIEAASENFSLIEEDLGVFPLVVLQGNTLVFHLVLKMHESSRHIDSVSIRRRVRRLFQLDMISCCERTAED